MSLAPVLLMTAQYPSRHIQEEYLREGFLLMAHNSVREALEAAAGGGHALVLIEYAYFGDAEQAVKGLRATLPETETTPIIVFGGEAPLGSDVAADWVAGDIVSEELRMHMHAAVRRSDMSNLVSISVFGDLELDMRRFRARRGDTCIRLTPVQMRLLKHLMDNPTIPFSRRELIEAVWNDRNVDERSVTAAVLRLRRALNQGGLPDLIRTIPDVGYALDYDGPGAGRQADA